MTVESSPSLDTLLANAAWVRRLAHGLLRDRAEAEEVAQEALLAGWRHPPATDRPARAWFGQVVRNLVINRAASERARARREGETALLAPPTVPSPEEMTAKVELQRLLVRLVIELDEPYRHTLLLRYFEERTAEEIARAHGIPAGTVRWRLKVAIERLRGRLEERERGPGWRARLLALALPLRPARPLLAAAPWLMVSFLATVALLLSVRGSGTAPPPPEPAASLEPVAPAPARLAAATPRDPGRCVWTVAWLRRQIWEAEAELRQYGEAGKLFEAAPASPTAQAAMAPLIERLFTPIAGSPPPVIECHTGACRVVVLASSQEEYEARFRPNPPAERELALRSWGLPRPRKYTRAVDPLSGQTTRRYVLDLALKDPEGRPLTGAVPEVPTRPAPTSAADCQAEVKALRARLGVVGPERDGVLPPWEQYRRQPSNSALTRIAQQQIQRSIGSEIPPGKVDCHGRVCRTLDFELAAHLGRDLIFMNAFRGPWREDSGAYFRAAAPDSSRNDADEFLRSLLWEKADRPRLGADLDGFLPIARCRDRFPADGQIGGRLTIHLVVPATGELNADGEAEKISVHLDGTAALASPFGQCLAAELHRRTEGVRVPQPMPARVDKLMQLGIALPARPR